MLEIAHITKSYRNKTVLSDISFDVAPGRFVSIIGPNGAGKSTLLSVVAQLAESSGGTVRLDGRPLASYHRKELSKRMSFLRQSNHLNLKLTVRELVAFGRFPYSGGRLTAEDNRAVDEAIAYLELEELSSSFIDRLSGGERQRAFIAMTIAQDTEYILLDEPLNNLDMKHSVQIMKTLRDMVDRLNKTVLLVIHDINFASYYSDEILALKKGRTVAHGSVSEIIRPDILNAVYDMDIEVNRVDGKLLCDYFA